MNVQEQARGHAEKSISKWVINEVGESKTQKENKRIQIQVR